ncbi:MAG: extracellular solute-binding protein [Pseudomonadota bacterium]
MGATMDPKTFRERLSEGRMDRRDLHRTLAAVGLSMVAVPMMSGAARAEDKDNLLAMTWAGYEIPEFVGEYVEEHGAQPEYSIFATQDEALAKIRAGFAPDTVHLCTTKTQKFADAEVIKPIDLERVPRWNDLWPRLREMKGVKLDDGEVYMVPVDWGSSSFCYRTDVFEGEGEETWAWLFDDRYAGRVAMQDAIMSIVAAGLVAGYDNPYVMPVDDLPELKDKLVDQRESGIVRFYWESPTEYVNALANGEVDIAMCWANGAIELQNQGIPVKYANPKEGVVTWVCGVSISANGEADDELVYDFIDAMLAPESGVYMIEGYGQGHSNTKAFDMVAPERLAELGFANPSEMMDTSVFSTASPAREAFESVWEEVKLGM